MKPMLASPAKDIKFPVYASPKIDGIRAYVQDGKLLSRSGKLIPNRFLQEILGHPPLNGADGELCIGPPYAKNLMQMTTSGVMSFDGQPNFTYWIFDIWSLDEPFELRYEKLKPANLASGHLMDLYKYKKIQFLPQVFITDPGGLDSYEEECLAQGYEGIMVRDPQGMYKFGRSTTREGALLKVKRWEDSEARITGFEEFQHNANEAFLDELGRTKRSSHQANKIGMNKLGAFLATDLATGQAVRIGTGFTDVQRQELWIDCIPKLVGKIVKYKHFANSGVKDAPRFPVFIGFRDERDMS